MNKKIIIGVLVFVLIIAIGVGIYLNSLNQINSENKEVVSTHQHSFTEATCEQPRICSICGETEREPLGHTIHYGKCERCGNKQNEEQGLELSNTILEINNNTTKCNNIITSANLNSPSNCYSKFFEASLKIKDNNTYLTKVIELCGDYSETTKIKEICNTLILTDISISSSDTESLTNFLKDFKEYLLNMEKLMNEMSAFAKLFV